MPVVESMPTAARAMPYIPAVLKEMKMPTQINRIGMTQDIMPTDMPLMIVVAEPVSDSLAILFTKR